MTGRPVMLMTVLVLVAAAASWFLLRPRATDVPFADLPVVAGRFGLDEEPLAAAGWPPCTRALLDLQIETAGNRVDLTVRPNDGVQCALPWAPSAWWTDGNGERIDVRQAPPASHPDLPLLVMGAAGASAGGGHIGTPCPVEPPLTYFMELDGQALEIASIDDPRCGGRRLRVQTPLFTYRFGGLETPAGWLDPSIEEVEVEGGRLRFVLEMLNDTEETITIGRCPFYDARFVAGRESARFRSYLNCPGAPDEVGPGDVLRFHIEMPLGNVSGRGRIELELRDENRMLNRIKSAPVEVGP